MHIPVIGDGQMEWFVSVGEFLHDVVVVATVGAGSSNEFNVVLSDRIEFLL